jgi:hypothetical protein
MGGVITSQYDQRAMRLEHRAELKDYFIEIANTQIAIKKARLKIM